MLRFSFALTFLLVALFSMVLTALHLQPYDDRPLRDLLLSDRCSLPCFMNIKPGRTTVADALDILRNHEWVDVASIDYQPSKGVHWMWNGQQPSQLDASHPARLIFNANATLIEQIWIGIHVHVGELHLLFGKPTFFTVGISQLKRFQARLTVDEYYAAEYFYTHAETTCPLHLASYLYLPIQQLTFFNERVSGGDLFARLPVFSAINAADYRVC